MSLLLNIYIFIAFVLDESVIHDVRQFFNSRWKKKYQSCDLHVGRDMERKIGFHELN